jgi:hypothetical protein
MSGLEIAGVVLAVFPILRFGLKAFQGDKFTTLAKYHRILRSIARELDLERVKLYKTCTKLFSPLINEESLAELLADSEASGWTDHKLASKVRNRLGGDKFELYIDTLEELADRIIALREELGFQDFVGCIASLQIILSANLTRDSGVQTRHLNDGTRGPQND